ncbi:MAG: hypothetical protein KBT02_04360 [Treponema sp.]|nr:hypothetical protein [Candidatus Treponema caballi]
MNDFLERMKEYLDKGVEVSREAVKTAGVKVQNLGDKSMTLIEVKQLENRIQQELQKLGLLVYDIFKDDAEKKIASDDEVIKKCLNDISYLNKEIDKRNAQLGKDKQ